MLLNIILFSSKSCRKVLLGVCYALVLFSIKIHAKCFQITHKSMALPILMITEMKHHFISLVLRKLSDEKQKFLWKCPSNLIGNDKKPPFQE